MCLHVSMYMHMHDCASIDQKKASDTPGWESQVIISF